MLRSSVIFIGRREVFGWDVRVEFVGVGVGFKLRRWLCKGFGVEVVMFVCGGWMLLGFVEWGGRGF